MHQNISYTYGRFNKVSGKIVWDAEKIENSSVTLSIPTKSIDTNNIMRDKHLKNPDFFEVKKHPKIEFESKKFELQENKNYLVTGDLTIHGVTKEMSFELQKTGEGKDMWGGYRVGFISDFSIVRSDFGMTHMLDSIGDEVFLTVSLEGYK